MVAIFGRQLGALATVYFRLKQFILDIYNGNVAYNADRSVLSATENNNKKKHEMWR